MNILVTGCNGQLGNEIQLLEKGNGKHVFFNTDVNELDITDENAINAFVDANNIDGIINCAAYTAVDKAESNEALCHTLNATAPGYLAAAMGKRGGWICLLYTSPSPRDLSTTACMDAQNSKANSSSDSTANVP